MWATINMERCTLCVPQLIWTGARYVCHNQYGEVHVMCATINMERCTLCAPQLIWRGARYVCHN